MLHCKYSLLNPHAKWANGHNIFAYICQNTTNSTFYFTCHVPETIMPTKVGVYANIFDMYILGRCMNIYMPHMKLLASILQQGSLYTYLTDILEQTWLPHSKYSSHYQHAIWHIDPKFYIYTPKHNQLHLLLPMLLPNIC